MAGHQPLSRQALQPERSPQAATRQRGCIRQAIETDRDDSEDLRCGVAALKDPADSAFVWPEVRGAAGWSRSYGSSSWWKAAGLTL